MAEECNSGRVARNTSLDTLTVPLTNSRTTHGWNGIARFGPSAGTGLDPFPVEELASCRPCTKLLAAFQHSFAWRKHGTAA